MANTTDVYNLNDELEKEKELEDNNMTAAYTNQLYGTGGDATAVSSSSDAANSDYSNYLTTQNEQLSSGADTTSTASTAENTAEQAAASTTSAVDTVGTTDTVATASTVDYSGLSEYDQKLSDEAKDLILQYRQQWVDAKARGDTAAMQEAYIQAQLVRAKYGGYISDTSNGMGYSEFGYGNLSLADQNLPEEAQDQILYWELQYMNASSDEDKKYAHEMANKVRSEYGGYTSTDGTDYIEDSIGVDDQYEYTGEDFVDPYADEIASLQDYLNNDTGWDASSYNPEEDAAYQAYADYYNRNGSAAANSALAQSAANTGGIASSYAQALAAAAQQSYAKQLTDVIPTLQSNAEQSYNDTISAKQALLSQLQSASSTAYDQYNTNRNFDYDTWLQNWQNAYSLYELANSNSQNDLDRTWQTSENELDRELDKYLAQLSL